MKRTLLLFSVLMLSCIALRAHDVVIDGIYYNLDTTNKTAWVTYKGDHLHSYNGEYRDNVTIPSSITYKEITYRVTYIGGYTFADCSDLISVTIPNSVISISLYAFSGCSGLTSVTIPESVTKIELGTFYNCSGLTSVSIPINVTSIGERAFEGCSKLTSVIWNAKNYQNSYTGFGNQVTSFTFGNEVEHIPASLCAGMNNLKEVTIPNSVTSIGGSAFSGCSGLTSVTIGESVTSIGSSAFWGCSELTSVTIPNSVTSIGGWTFSGCSGLTSITIPNSVTSIRNDVFAGCSGLTSVTIPNSVTSIGNSAFSGCSELTSVTIGDNVTSIENGAFKNCSGLTSVTIPNSVTSIGSDAFNGTGIYNKESNWDNGVLYIDNCLIKAKSDVVNGSYTIKEGTRVIAAAAFNGCSGLTSVTIPNSVTSIGYSAFENCSGLTEVTIPNSVTSIGSSAFSGCSKLTSVIWNAKNGKGISFFSSDPFFGIRSQITSFSFGNEVEYIPTYLCSGMSKLTEITIPNSVTFIGSCAFRSCSGLTEVTIPNSVTSIGSSAFSGCSGLTSVIWNAKNCEDFEDYDETPFDNTYSTITSFTFGNEVEHIPAYLCYGMSNLKEMTIPNSVTDIGGSAFENCSGLTSVTIGESVTAIGYDAFSGCSGLTSVTIPNSVTYIGKNAFDGCSGLTSVLWNAKNHTSIYSYDRSPFYTIRHNIFSFTFGDEVEYIPGYLCYGMSNLKEMTIPNSVTYTGGSVFENCSGLTSVTIPNRVTSIAEGAFRYCSGLTSVTIPNSVRYIGNYAFSGCSGLTSVTIPNSVTSIRNDAFAGCSGLTSVTIGENVTSIGRNAFQNCGGLTKVNYLGTVDKWAEIDFNTYESNPTFYANNLYINNELLTDVKITEAKSIKDYAFYNCQSIKSVEIGNSVASIGFLAFKDCSGLTSITISNNVTQIIRDTFKNCSGLKSVSIGESVNTIGSGAFAGCDNLKKITMYPMNVPNMEGTDIFAHYNAYLYVPCDVYEDYDLDDVFGNFKYIKCIAADEVDAPDKVEIDVDNDNNATITWPSTDGAKSYELEITKNGKVFCTLLFNEDGQLTSIDFGNRAASVGFQFTVTGLDGASKYAYSMVAMDKKGNELQSYKGTFTTNGYVPGPGEEDDPSAIIETLADANITISNGLITVADADFSIYNLAGQDVTALNGNLLPGVYMVSLNGNIAKVMVK